MFIERISLLSCKVMSVLTFCFAFDLFLRSGHRSLPSDVPPGGVAIGELTQTQTGVTTCGAVFQSLCVFVELKRLIRKDRSLQPFWL